MNLLCYAMNSYPIVFIFFFFNDTATTEIYTLSLHDALPISDDVVVFLDQMTEDRRDQRNLAFVTQQFQIQSVVTQRSEEHTSELQSQFHLVCRLLLEKKKKKITNYSIYN